MTMQRNIYVTIKGTLRCNLACQYCYGRDNHAIGAQMTEEEIHQALTFTRDYALETHATSLTLCWHGGEPLLLSSVLPAYMEEANRLFSAIGVKVHHGLQTNAVALLPRTFDFIKQYLGGHVGVSLDLFSSYRTFPDGTLSTQLAVDNIDRALAAGISCGAINLVTRDNLHRIPDIYNFYKQRRMNVRLARVFPIHHEATEHNPMYLSDEEFAQAMTDYFDLWANDSQPAHNQDIVNLIGDLLFGKPSVCFRERECHKRYLALSPGGEIFTCAEFDVPESVVGNFLTQSAHDFVRSDSRDKLALRAPVPQQCAACKFLRICHGGCFRERFMLGYPYRCKSNYLYWEHVVRWLEAKGAGLCLLADKPADEARKILKQSFKP